MKQAYDLKIVILDGYTENPGDLSWAGLNGFGQVEYYDRTSEDEILSRIQKADIVLTNKTPLRKENLSQCPSLKYIGVLATGYDVVDIGYCKEHNIVVTNVPGYGTKAVAQFAIALLLEVCNRVGYHAKAVQEGKWNAQPDWCFWDYPLIELADKTMGIIGLGRIGQSTAKIASALGMKVQYFDEYVNTDIYKKTSLEELLKTSDVICLHCPLTKDNYHIISKESLQLMKKNAILINNSRGKLVDEQALAKALENNEVFAAALDVTNDEPIDKDSPLLKLDNCIITPHISWAARESRQRIMDTTIENLKAFLEGKTLNRVEE